MSIMSEQAEQIQEARAILRGYRATPRKARQVVDLIRGKGVEEARAILKFTPRHAARTVEKLLRSAVANAAQKAMRDPERLRIVRATVDPGRTFKVMYPRAMGRGNFIRKRSSHITLVVAEDPKLGRSSRRARR